MKTIGILEKDDVILATDYVRYLEIEYCGQSDTVSTRSTYSGTPINFFRWLTVKEAGWMHFIGKTVGYVEKAINRMERAHQPLARYEFARGDIPESHKLVLRKD